MPLPNRSLTNNQLIDKARYYVQMREDLMRKRSILLKKREVLLQRDSSAKAVKGSQRWQTELFALQSHAYIYDVLLQETAMDRQLVLDEMFERALCNRGNELLFLGVWRHDD